MLDLQQFNIADILNTSMSKEGMQTLLTGIAHCKHYPDELVSFGLD